MVRSGVGDLPDLTSKCCGPERETKREITMDATVGRKLKPKGRRNTEKKRDAKGKRKDIPKGRGKGKRKGKPKGRRNGIRKGKRKQLTKWARNKHAYSK